MTTPDLANLERLHAAAMAGGATHDASISSRFDFLQACYEQVPALIAAARERERLLDCLREHLERQTAAAIELRDAKEAWDTGITMLAKLQSHCESMAAKNANLSAELAALRSEAWAWKLDSENANKCVALARAELDATRAKLGALVAAAEAVHKRIDLPGHRERHRGDDSALPRSTGDEGVTTPTITAAIAALGGSVEAARRFIASNDPKTPDQVDAVWDLALAALDNAEPRKPSPLEAAAMRLAVAYSEWTPESRIKWLKLTASLAEFRAARDAEARKAQP